MAILFLNSVKTSSILNLWKENYFKTTNKQTKGRKKKKKRKKWKRWNLGSGKWTVNFTSSRGRAVRLCVHLYLLPALAAQQQVPLLSPALWLPWIPALAHQLSPPDRVCSSWRLRAPHWMDPSSSLLYPASSVKLARRHRAWDLSPFQMCLKLASVFKSN